MKKILLYAITMAFVLALGVTYANAGGMKLYNGVTDFSGWTHDTLSDIGMSAPGATIDKAVDGSNGGGPRADVPGLELNNGVTDFSGRT